MPIPYRILPVVFCWSVMIADLLKPVVLGSGLLLINKLCEYLDVNEAYSHLDTAVKPSSKPSESHDHISQTDYELVDEEALLVRLG
nr:hypothetical protein [Vibrio nitrifigilis]